MDSKLKAVFWLGVGVIANSIAIIALAVYLCLK